MNINNVIISGYVTITTEKNTTASGYTVGKFSILVPKKTRDKKPMFFKVVCFGKTADFAELHVLKGSQVLIEGSLDKNEYEYEGKQIKDYSIIARNINMIKWANTKEEKDVELLNEYDTKTLDIDDYDNNLDEDLPF